MVKSLTAVYDGKAFRPDEPVQIKPNTRVRLVVELPDEAREGSFSFLRTALSLNLEGPADWSERFEDYLYGSRDD